MADSYEAKAVWAASAAAVEQFTAQLARSESKLLGAKEVRNEEPVWDEVFDGFQMVFKWFSMGLSCFKAFSCCFFELFSWRCPRDPRSRRPSGPPKCP